MPIDATVPRTHVMTSEPAPSSGGAGFAPSGSSAPKATSVDVIVQRLTTVVVTLTCALALCARTVAGAVTTDVAMRVNRLPTEIHRTSMGKLPLNRPELELHAAQVAHLANFTAGVIILLRWLHTF